eukprot:638779-Amphidinium_carterae.1
MSAIEGKAAHSRGRRAVIVSSALLFREAPRSLFAMYGTSWTGGGKGWNVLESSFVLCPLSSEMACMSLRLLPSVFSCSQRIFNLFSSPLCAGLLLLLG